MEASNANEHLLVTYLQLLLDAGFGNGSSSSNLFHMYALHTQFQELALKSANTPSSDLPKAGLSVRSGNDNTFSARSKKSMIEDLASAGKSSVASRSLANGVVTYMFRLPLHYYLKINPAENIRPRIVDLMVRFCETWLLDVDSDRRTPLHNALLVLLLPLKETTARSKSKVQHASSVVEMLLSGPGCNALKINQRRRCW